MQNGLPVSLQLPIDQFFSAFLEEQIVALPLQTGKTLEVSQLFVQVPILRYWATRPTLCSADEDRSARKLRKKKRLIDVTTSREEYITTLLTKSMDNLTPLESSGSMILYLVGDVRTDSEVNVRPCMCVVEVIY